MSEHYNVDETIASFIASHAAAKLPNTVPNFAKVQFRNQGVAIEFMRMVLTERNRGTSHNDLILATSNIMVDFIQNFAAPYGPDQQEAVFNMFMGRIHQLLTSVAEGTSNHIITGKGTIVSERGGHA